MQEREREKLNVAKLYVGIQVRQDRKHYYTIRITTDNR